jgi:type II restriction enzyme
VRELGKTDFTLDEVYVFDKQLQKLHPENKHIHPKIRQQLQILRDKGILEFKGKGKYSFR